MPRPLAQLERDGAGWANAYRTNSPVGSGLVFFGSELLQLPVVATHLQSRLPASTCAQLPALLGHLGDQDFLAPWESLFTKDAEPDDPSKKFEIPEEDRPLAGGDFGVQLAEVIPVVLQGSDFILQPRSWPQIFPPAGLAYASFFLSGNGPYFSAESFAWS